VIIMTIDAVTASTETRHRLSQGMSGPAPMTPRVNAIQT